MTDKTIETQGGAIKVLALTNMDNTLALKEAVEKVWEKHGRILSLKKHYFSDWEDPRLSLENLETEVKEAAIVLVDIRGDVRLAREMSRLLSGDGKTVVVLIGGSRDIFSLTRMGKFRGEKLFKAGSREKEFDVNAYLRTKKFSALTKKLGSLLSFSMLGDMRNWVLCQEYYAEGDATNLQNMLILLLKEYGGYGDLEKPDPPQRQADYGLYLPGVGNIADLDDFRKESAYRPDLPDVGVLFYGGMHYYDTGPVVDTLYDYLSEKVNLIPVFSRVEYNLLAMEKFFVDVEVVINLQYFRLHGGPYGGDPEPTYRLMQKFNVPFITGLRAFETEIDKWSSENRGLSPLEVILGITLPELDGAIEPIFVAPMESFSDSHIGKVKRQAVLEDRVRKLGDRTLSWVNLRHLKNGEKKIAILTYDYPPGESNLASAGYLDVFSSLKVFLGKMSEKGYNLSVPTEPLAGFFVQKGLLNTPRYQEEKGIRLSLDCYLSWFNSLSPGLQQRVIDRWGEPPGDIMAEGNTLILPAYRLGNVLIGVQPSRGYHEQADKAYHDRDLPPTHQYLAFYFYLQHEFGAHAVLHFGMHGTLEFQKGKEVALSGECFPDLLIGNMPHLYFYWIGNTSESSIAKRRSYALCISHGSPPVKNAGLYENYLLLEDLLDQWESAPFEDTFMQIEETAEELHLTGEPAELRREINRLKRRLIPHGMYIMDREWSEDELGCYLNGVLRHDREYPSLLKILAAEEGVNWPEVKDTKQGEEIATMAGELSLELVRGNVPSWLPDGYGEYAQTILSAVKGAKEAKGLLRALNGEYILPARGGDPVRDPEVYPSGRAMYAFDPRSVPTVAAQVRGRESVSRLLDYLKQKNGNYPETVAIVLWGFETMKTGGDTVAAILELLGIRLKKKSAWFNELELLSISELKRPRIDVMITICGIFRDTFPTHVDLLNRAIELAAGLPESPEDNYVRKHYIEQKEELGDLSLARIFGPAPEEYATTVTNLVESGNWDKELELAEEFDNSMQHAYLPGRMEKSSEAYSTTMQNVEAIFQERDNIEYEVTDLDHYYEFMGGLAASLREKTGREADIMVFDTTEEEVEVEELQSTIERASRTRIFNPAWLDGMLEHDFHGSKKIKDRVEYLMGFAATTGKVNNWIFEEVGDRLIFNEEMRRRLQDNNPYAAVEIGELLLEIERRGYWQTTSEKLDQLRDIVMEMEGNVE